MRMVLVGGVPGAGESTALARLAGQAGVRVLDPDRVRAYVLRRLPRLRLRRAAGPPTLRSLAAEPGPTVIAA